MPLAMLLSIAIHSAYVGSKVVVSLLALDSGVAPVFWLNAINLATVGYLSRKS